MQAKEPQAILASITAAAIFLTLTVDSGAEDGVRDLLSDVSGLRRSVGFRIPEAELTMFIGKPPGNHDRILDFSTALTGNLFFVPTVDFLDDPTPAPAPLPSAEDPVSSDGSLGIGSLKAEA